jgi:hypothetical protein
MELVLEELGVAAAALCPADADQYGVHQGPTNKTPNNETGALRALYRDLLDFVQRNRVRGAVVELGRH